MGVDWCDGCGSGRERHIPILHSVPYQPKISISHPFIFGGFCVILIRMLYKITFNFTNINGSGTEKGLIYEI